MPWHLPGPESNTLMAKNLKSIAQKAIVLRNFCLGPGSESRTVVVVVKLLHLTSGACAVVVFRQSSLFIPCTVF